MTSARNKERKGPEEWCDGRHQALKFHLTTLSKTLLHLRALLTMTSSHWASVPENWKGSSAACPTQLQMHFVFVCGPPPMSYKVGRTHHRPRVHGNNSFTVIEKWTLGRISIQRRVGGTEWRSIWIEQHCEWRRWITCWANGHWLMLSWACKYLLKTKQQWVRHAWLSSLLNSLSCHPLVS